MMAQFDHTICGVHYTRSTVVFELGDGREIHAPREWFPALSAIRDPRTEPWRIVDDGDAVEWPRLGERVSSRFLLSLRQGLSAVAEPSVSAQGVQGLGQ